MNEFLDECHLCGHVMASAAPACPNCFGRSDPIAREANRLARARRAWQLGKQWEDGLRAASARRAAKADSERLKTKIYLGFVCLFCIPTTLIANGFAWASIFPVVAYFVWLFREHLFTSTPNSLENKERESLVEAEVSSPYARTSGDLRLGHRDHPG